MPVSEENRAALLKCLKEQAFFRQKVILSSGKESDYYIDARRVTLSSLGGSLAGRCLWEAAQDYAFDALGGPTLGADPMLGAIAVWAHQEGRDLPLFIIRKAAKTHGRGRRIEGPDLPRGSRVVLIDDVATTGKAFLESLDALKEAGVSAVAALCLVDREEGAREAVETRGCPFQPLFTASEFF